ncbi:MAG: hypothetical protein LRY73_17460 [Bacillus sp. (in: Bacteria)]|nr:hypothetical protein [Bacillus sp. (in: firmicutes)]
MLSYRVLIICFNILFILNQFGYFLSPTVTICVIASVLAIVFIKDQKKRIPVVTTALILGEIIFIFSLWERSHVYFDSFIIGDFLLLDMFSLNALILVIWNGLETGAGLLRNKWVTNTPKPVGQGKLNA